MKKYILMLALVLPLLVAAQKPLQIRYKTVSFASGYYDPVASVYYWDTFTEDDIPIIIDLDQKTVTVNHQDTYTMHSFTKVSQMSNHTYWTMEATNQEGTYCIIDELMPESNKYSHLLYIMYPDYILRYEIQPL